MAGANQSISPYFPGWGFTGGAHREDLIDEVTNFDPQKVPFMNMVGKGVSKGPSHDWIDYALPSTSTAGTTIGLTFTSAERPRPTRVVNWNQIFRDDVAIPDSELEYEAAGGLNTVRRHATDGLLNINRNMEARVFAISGGSSSGSTGAGVVMKAISDFMTAATENAFASDATAIGGDAAGTKSTVITEDKFNLVLGQIFDDTDDTTNLDVFGNRYVVEQINEFTTNTREIQADRMELYRPVIAFYSSFGVIRINLDRWVPAGTGGTGDDADGGHAFFLNMRFIRFCFLRRPRFVPMGKRGDSTDFIVLAEGTLEMKGVRDGVGAAHARVYEIKNSIT